MSSKNLADVMYIRESFMIRRFHTIGHIHKEETVGHHTANVLAFLFYLYDDVPPLYLVKACLHHDVAELATGDIPATAKWQHSDLAQVLTRIEHGVKERHNLYSAEIEEPHASLLKFADMLDLCFKSVEELAVGNDPFHVVLFNGLQFLEGLMRGPLKNHQRATELLATLFNNRFVDIQEMKNEVGTPEEPLH
jgi:5'-deoxynucleotidase YfbR-like HD superfamily hydrolase